MSKPVRQYSLGIEQIENNVNPQLKSHPLFRPHQLLGQPTLPASSFKTSSSTLPFSNQNVQDSLSLKLPKISNYSEKLDINNALSFSTDASVEASGALSLSDLSCSTMENTVQDERSAMNNGRINDSKPWLFPSEYIYNGTPSRKAGISYESELDRRCIGTTHIRDLCKLLKLKSISNNNACVYFHRFYMLRSFHKYEPIRIACACLYLACKFEDNLTFKDHLVRTSYMLVHNKKLTKTDKVSCFLN